MIPYGRQSISQADIDAVVEVLQSDFLTQGPAVERFEAGVTSMCGAAFGVAVNSATSALHLACRSLGLGEGDYLWTSPNTFVASANCALYCGAQVDFVDIEASTGNMDADKLRDKLIAAKQNKRLPKIVVPVHFSGQPCDMQAIAALADEFGFAVIEDASHAIGATYQNQRTGSCQYSDITVFSFHPVKIVTTGEGGLAVTNNKALADKMQLLRSHGITRDAPLMSEASHGPWYYQQVELGYNYRMTDIQAALGLSQLGRLDEFIRQRHKIAERYDSELAALPLQLPEKKPERISALHLYVVQLSGDVDPQRHREVFEALRQHGIGTNVHYIPVHTQPWYQAMGFNWGDFSIAENYYHRALSLPIYPTLTDTEQTTVINSLKEVLL